MQLALDLGLCGRVGGEEQIGAVLFNAELEVRQDFQHAISSVSTTQRLMTVAASSSRMRMLLTPASSSRFSRARVDSSLTRRRSSFCESALRTASRSEEHTSELQSLMRISYAVFCLKKHIHNYTMSLTSTLTHR